MVTCNVIQPPLNGEIINLTIPYKYNENIRFRCNEGYKLIGSNTLKCLANGEWLGHMPTCEGEHLRIAHYLITHPE